MKNNLINAIITEIDFSHGIIFALLDNGEEVEATWSGFINLEQGDEISLVCNNDVYTLCANYTSTYDYIINQINEVDYE